MRSIFELFVVIGKIYHQISAKIDVLMKLFYKKKIVFWFLLRKRSVNVNFFGVEISEKNICGML